MQVDGKDKHKVEHSSFEARKSANTSLLLNTAQNK
jgi:hypothetical protein